MAKAMGIADARSFAVASDSQASGKVRVGVVGRIASFFDRQADRDIEYLVRERGGVMSDALERDIDRFLSGQTLF
jgi:hypothetical protein